MSERLTYTSGALGQEVDQQFEASLARARATAPTQLPHLIAGRLDAEGEALARRDPCAPERVASSATAASPATVQRALASARAAAPQWQRTPYRERCEHLRGVARAIGDRHIEIAGVISLETGKTRAESIAEVQEAIDLIEAYSAQIEAADGFRAPLAGLTEREHNTDTLRAYGVFAVISPFNFPLALAVNMLSAALLAGNTVVAKPSELTPWTGALLAEALLAGGLPEGVANLVQGGAQAGQALVAGDIDGVAFTGSVPVGRKIAATLAAGRWQRPVLAEMGGKNPTIVTARADLDAAAEGIVRAAFGLSGQKCSACSRAIVCAPVYEGLLERIASYTRAQVVGDPADRRSTLGPVIDEDAYARFEQSCLAAERDGRVLAGGSTAPDPTRRGYFVEPTVVGELPIGHPLTRQELFLPFLTVTRVEGLDAAIAEANDVDYGLAAGIFSEDEREVQEFLDRLEAGVLYVNRRAGATTGAWPGAQSFCGWKSSGLTGKGGLGPHYLAQFMREQSRTVVR